MFTFLLASFFKYFSSGPDPIILSCTASNFLLTLIKVSMFFHFTNLDKVTNFKTFFVLI